MKCNNSGLIKVHRKRQDNWYNYIITECRVMPIKVACVTSPTN